jgi:MOSC domain-containing protein YiiM
MAHVEDLYITVIGGEPMQQMAEIEALAGAGLQDDRYATRKGYWTGVDECQVTLIEGEALDSIRATTDVRVSNGEHRRNIVTRGIWLRDVAGKRFAVGDALFEYDRPRPPCRYIQSRSERGMTKALGDTRGGICARVIEGGLIRVGDPIEIVAPTARSRSWSWGL